MAEQRDHILESLKKQTGDAHEATQNRWSNLLLEAQGAIETRQKHFVQVSAAAIEYGCKIAGHLTEAGRGISSNALGIGLQIAQTATNFVRDVEHIRQGSPRHDSAPRSQKGTGTGGNKHHKSH
eukprot:gnl/TRDRNA2_/TRDRNA2_162570_c0_seq3.p1 gnl/TRDRNA2_/TRDRNA2_162570_c0~~gnl/TRDRNA2_/TRDRNA2_162570_c0_seq3.p1  ORF type:complete len:124 (+),score=11.40 gnl/TRDRNA2_/TRDRNA2_162570_c0_seq3:510-881(+)